MVNTGKVVIYHNPRCSKSRQALDLIRSRGIEPEIVEYLKTPPDSETLADILSRLGLPPRELMRTNEAEYKAAGLDDPALDQASQIRRMVENPRVIQRPIVLANGRAVVGRPPEAVLDIL